ncbi:MAG: T9SS type A sorting domain-containing protein, partial [Bacteroidia bacterium]|nr:T9SS type A sorting domain-containing protein [Bacteroidia bacterium]
YDSAIVGMPLRSGLANSTDTSYGDYSTGNYFNYYKKLLYQGYHLGIGYDHDNHYTNFGRSNGGRLVILAPSLTRANLYSAMKQMHFYGSDDPNVKVDFSMNGSIMGSIIGGNSFPTFQVVHNDPDGEQADTIKIWKGYKGSGGLWAWIAKSTVNNNTLLYSDNSLVQGQEYYYFAEIRQKDGQWIVTSPIWYTYGMNTFVSEVKKEQNQLLVFPNPVRETLYFSSSEKGPFRVIIKDMTGRIVLEEFVSEDKSSLSISALNNGMYILSLENGKVCTTRKLCVDH